VNFGIPAPLLFGLILVVASLSLFLTSKFKPELHQESDNIYAVIGVVCGLLLLTQLDLGIGMAFQQMLMIGTVITLMWQYVQVRAENKRLKGSGGGRSNSGRETGGRRSGYAAKIDEEPEYAAPVRSTARRLNSDRQDQWNNYDDEYDQPVRDNGRMLPEYRRADQVDDMPRQRSEYSDYEAPEARDYNRRSNTDNVDRQQPPVAENRSRRSRRSNSAEPATPSRNRRRSSIDDSADEPAAKSSAYVDYEPVDSVVPEGEDKPLQFPDQY
jgi:Ycf66 protein N-terminus